MSEIGIVGKRPDNRNGTEWLEFIMEQGGAAPRAMVRTIATTWANITDERPDTIGHYLKNKAAAMLIPPEEDSE